MFKNISDKQGASLIFLSGVCWGVNGPFIEYLVHKKGCELDILIPYRFLIAGALMLCFCIFQKITTKELFTNKKDLIKLMLFTFFGIFISQYCYFYAVSLSGSAIATVIQFMAPIFIISIVCFEEKRKPTLKEIICFLLVFFGAFLLVTNGNINKLVITPLALVFCILSMVGAVGNSILPRQINKKYSPIFILGVSMEICGLILGLKNDILFRSFYIDFEILLVFFGVIFIGTICSFSCFMIGLKKIGAAKATILSSNVPVIATLLSYFWLGNSLYMFQIIGFILIILAIVLVFLKKVH